MQEPPVPSGGLRPGKGTGALSSEHGMPPSASGASCTGGEAGRRRRSRSRRWPVMGEGAGAAAAEEGPVVKPRDDMVVSWCAAASEPCHGVRMGCDGHRRRRVCAVCPWHVHPLGTTARITMMSERYDRLRRSAPSTPPRPTTASLRAPSPRAITAALPATAREHGVAAAEWHCLRCGGRPASTTQPHNHTATPRRPPRNRSARQPARQPSAEPAREQQQQ
ncbi:hypothetical protein P171DRAFT_245537 [Karstenula rhodostoma CBS 690.94]|uniref:Uncharacterized protein n=1 Tax=Karstenula rhodostoma CBS 690.94 TaxID=1392251 RepID=A0A9P4UE64_9PLEO|nr:hypothetical protein P171DRAFT_245537 [Karstenula rhodostoma CBS 690.94]